MNTAAETPRPREPIPGESRQATPSITQLAADWRAAWAQFEAVCKREDHMEPPAYALAEAQAQAVVDQVAARIDASRSADVQELAAKYRLILEHCSDRDGDINLSKLMFAFLADLDALAALHVEASAKIQSEPGIKTSTSLETLESYNAWLFYERRLLALEMYPERGPKAERWIPADNAGAAWHSRGPGSWRDKPQPSTRAALVLTAVGVFA